MSKSNTFYDSLPIYDYVLALSPFSHHDYLAFLFKHLDGAYTVLDAGCGYGRVSVPLARKGYKVAGFDPSKKFLAEGRRYARQAGVTVQYRVGSLPDIPFRGPFDVTICMHGSFNCLESEQEQVEALRNMAARTDTLIVDLGPANWERRKEIEVVKVHGKAFWSGLRFENLQAPPTRLFARDEIGQLIDRSGIQDLYLVRLKGKHIHRFILVRNGKHYK